MALEHVRILLPKVSTSNETLFVIKVAKIEQNSILTSIKTNHNCINYKKQQKENASGYKQLRRIFERTLEMLEQ
jgi:hypothetical protein